MLRRQLLAATRALHRTSIGQRRADAARARMDARDRRQERRDRTRRLIELGGLVAKSGLEDIIATIEPDLSATLLGALLEVADTLEHQPDARARTASWCRRGRDALREA